MRIKTRVKIGGVLTFCVLLAYGGMIVYLDRTMSYLAQEVREANEIVNKISILRNLTQDYLLYRTERAHRQWSAVYAEVRQLLDNPELLVLKNEPGIGDAPQKLKVVSETFSRLMAMQQAAGPDSPEAAARDELQNRLTTQLLLATQDLTTRFFNLTETLNGKLIATQRLISSLDLLALLVLGILLLSNSVFLQRSVIKPVLKLHEGAEIVGAGNLDYKVGMASPNEIGELSQAFDRMTANLQQVTVSRDDLVREVIVRRRAEKALQESEENYSFLFNHMLDGFAYCKMHFEQDRPVDFTYLSVNGAFETLTGLKNVIGKKVSEIIPGIREANPELLERYGRVALTGKPERFEFYLDPLKMWLSISVYSPQKEYFVAIFDVITERKRAEQALRESREDLNQAQAVAHTGSWRLNVQKNELTWSDENHRIFGIPPGTPLNYETFLGAVHPDDREYVDREWQAALKGEPYDIEHRIIADGKVKWVRERAELEFNPEGQLLGGFGTTQDITGRKQAEDDIKHLASFPQMNPAPVLETDLSGAITFYNRAALEAVEALGPEADLAALIPEDLEKIVAAIKEKQQKFFYREVRIKDKVFGQNIYFAESFNMLRIYSMDITQRQQAEEKLRRTLENLERSNQELEQFAYISSHDLQEPLRKIANFSDMLVHQYQGRLDEQAERYFGYITDGAKRMQALINDLLQYSRVGRAEMPLVPASLEEVLTGVIGDLQTLIKECGAEISHDPLPTMLVNPHQMERLLQNLIANGIKFHCEGCPRIHLSARQEGREWVISVRDNGIGFDCQYAEGIFKVFKRLHAKEEYPGTGIGLAICKKIVERHGGRIWAESEPGQGSTFYFTIPA